MNTKELMLGLALGVLAALLASGCDDVPTANFDWNPATMRCQTWIPGEDGHPRWGDFVEEWRCKGKPTPIVLEVQ